MALAEELERSGNWLFRWRGWLPLIALAVLLLDLRHYRYLGGSRRVDELWELGCFLVATFGLCIRAHVVGHAPKDTSGRNARDYAALMGTNNPVLVAIESTASTRQTKAPTYGPN